MRKFALAVLLSSPLFLLAQISGTVYSYENGKTEPLPNANLFWKNSDKGVVADKDGKFTIEKEPGHTVLVASFIGYTRQEKVIISQQGKTDFILQPSDGELADVTVIGKAKATQIDNNMASLSYRIDDQELRKAACCNLSESFETNASVDVSFSDAITGTKQIEMLGLAGKYALIQRENIPYARGLNATSGLSFIPGPFIESIQLTKGLSSVLNGYESITGQINVEYFKPETAPKFYLNAFGNGGARSEINLLGTTRWNDNVGSTAMLHGSIIPFAQDRNDDNFADIPVSSQVNFTGRTHFRNEKGWEGQFGANLVQERKRGGTMAFAEENDPNAWGFTSLENRAELFGKTGYIFEDDVNRSIGIIYSGSLHRKEATFGERNYKGEQQNVYLNTIFQDIIGNTSHTYRTGVSFLGEYVEENLDSTLETSLYNSQRSEFVPGAYFEYTFSPDPKFTMVSGIRADYNTYFEQVYITPRLNIRYALTELTTFRLGGGRGQRTPNAISENLSILASSRSLDVANEILPEIGWNAGFSWDQYLPLGEKQLHLTTDAFYTWFDNKLITDLDVNPRQAYIYNREGSRFFSLLSQIDYEWFKGFESRLAYKYLSAQEQFINGFNQSYSTPRHRAFLNLSYATQSEWKFDATLNWFGEMRLPNSKLSPVEFQRPAWAPSFFTVSTQINKQLKGWEFFVGADNLLNFKQDNPIVNAENPGAAYFDSNFVWGPIFGRMIYAGLYYQLD